MNLEEAIQAYLLSKEGMTHMQPMDVMPKPNPVSEWWGGVKERAADPAGSVLDMLAQAYGYQGTPEMQQAFSQVPAAIPEGLPVGMGGFPVMGGIMAGQKAANAPLDMLDIAMQAEAKGMPKERIMDATGWFKGADDKWRFEIDDSMASQNFESNFAIADKQKDVILGEVEKLERQIRGIEDYAKQYNEGMITFDELKEANEMHKFLKGKLDNANNEMSGLYSGMPERNMKVVSAVNHPALFGQYPEIAGFDVRLGNEPGASYAGRQINLGGNANLSQASHELQHGVQDIEGFARGGSPTLYDFPESEGVRLATQLRATQQRYIEAKRLGKDPYGIENSVSGVKKEYERAKQEWMQFKEESKAVREGGPREAYRRLAGETEARNVQSRLNLSPDDRRMLYPWLTEDVPILDQIVRFR